MGLFDYFVADLECPRCHRVTKTKLQTKALRQPNHLELHIGDAFPIVHERALDTDYLAVKPTRPGEPIRMLEYWVCPNCPTEYNWAQVVIDQGHVQKIEAIVVDRKVIENAHYAKEIILSELDIDDDEDYALRSRLRGDEVEA